MALIDLDIINSALNLIGANEISSLDEGSREANVAGVMYDDIYESELAAHPWGFAKAKVLLAQLTSTPLNEWEYAYQLPTDLIRLLNTNSTQDYEILEDKLYSNENTVEIEYITRIDESKLPKWFKVSVMYRLASDMCVAITSNRTLAESLDAAYQVRTKNARFINDDQQPAETWVDSPFIDVR